MGYNKKQEKEKKVAQFTSDLTKNDPETEGKRTKKRSKKVGRKDKRESNMTTRDYLVSLIE
ncbi:MAG: hypothetical protein WEA56_11170 [Balneolaceae bacterium]